MKKAASRIYMLLVFLFLYAPIIVMMVFSFNESKSRTVFTGFTLDWYYKLFQNDVIISALGNTMLVAVIASIASTVIGTAAAIGIFAMNKRLRSFVLNVTYIPILNPEIVTGVSLMLLFGFIGLNLGLTTLVLAHITFCVPYVILNVMPKLRQMNISLYEAAQDLGCSPVRAFFKVVIPEIMPGIITGFLMAFTYSLDDFVVSYFTTGATSQTLPIAIYSMTRRKVSPQINALSTLIFIAVLLILLLMNIRDARAYKRASQNKKGDSL